MVGEPTPAPPAYAAPAGVEVEPEEGGRRSRHVLVAPRPADRPAASMRGTRERILDVALDLFTEKGFEATSLREIAERLGVTKAALYYHFPSKEEILRALHLRVHRLFEDALAAVRGDLSTVGAWATFLDGCVSTMLDNRRLLIMHERNRTAFENLQQAERAGPGDPFGNVSEMLRSSELSLRDRARIVAARGALVAGTTVAGVGSDASLVEAAEILRAVVRDILQPAPGCAFE